ncbi:uncharacterized protein LOC126656911 [Mercurialis annua]|uniref:uncharacterized protein LOC126656911 n=1 Tax=Mercurialis annua TaxID=3986 RepID=UPI00216064F7|nr:uncharacterized protein LOC126656911 [Mercurialis annua]
MYKNSFPTLMLTTYLLITLGKVNQKGDRIRLDVYSDHDVDSPVFLADVPTLPWHDSQGDNKGPGVDEVHNSPRVDEVVMEAEDGPMEEPGLQGEAHSESIEVEVEADSIEVKAENIEVEANVGNDAEGGSESENVESSDSEGADNKVEGSEGEGSDNEVEGSDIDVEGSNSESDEEGSDSESVEEGSESGGSKAEGSNAASGSKVESSESSGCEGDKSDGNQSTYFSDSDLGSYEVGGSGSDEGTAKRRKSGKRKYSEKSTSDLAVGMTFADAVEVKKAIADVSVVNGKPIKFIKNEPNRVRVGCFEKNCPFLFFAARSSKDERMMIMTLNLTHRCGRKFQNRSASARFVADKAKRKVLTELNSNYKVEFARLDAYAAEIRRTNHGSSVQVEVCPIMEREGRRVFRRMFICFETCKRGWLNGCRPIIGMDGCFLKGVTQGQLLCAVGKDGNNHMYPIARAIVDVEDKDN